MPPVMEFPEDIPAITVEGTPITEEAFPRRKQRREALGSGKVHRPDRDERPRAAAQHGVDLSGPVPVSAGQQGFAEFRIAQHAATRFRLQHGEIAFCPGGGEASGIVLALVRSGKGKAKQLPLVFLRQGIEQGELPAGTLQLRHRLALHGARDGAVDPIGAVGTVPRLTHLRQDQRRGPAFRSVEPRSIDAFALEERGKAAGQRLSRPLRPAE